MGRPRKKEEPKKIVYEATLKNLGKFHTACGDTPVDAIRNIPLERARGIGVLTIKHGDKEKVLVLSPVQSQNLFSTRGKAREVNLKQIGLRFSNL